MAFQMAQFPSEAYSTAQEKWIGRDHLITPSILKQLEDGRLIRGKNVLDVGCGNGHYSRDMLKWGAASVTGVDSSPEMIALCQSQPSPNLQFQVADVAAQLETNQTFDVAVGFFVLQFIHDKDALKKAIVNICSVLTRNGTFIGIVPNGVPDMYPTSEMGEKLGAAIERAPGSRFQDGQLLPVNFYEGTEIVGNSVIAFHSIEFYDRTLREAGFRKVEWTAPQFDDHAQNLLGADFCSKWLNPPCDVIFKASK